MLVGEFCFAKVKDFPDHRKNYGSFSLNITLKKRERQTSRIIETCCSPIAPESRIHLGTLEHGVNLAPHEPSYTYHFAALGKLPVHSASGTLKVFCNVGSTARLNGGGVHSSI